MTVKELKEYLNKCPDDYIIKYDDTEYIQHVSIFTCLTGEDDNHVNIV